MNSLAWLSERIDRLTQRIKETEVSISWAKVVSTSPLSAVKDSENVATAITSKTFSPMVNDRVLVLQVGKQSSVIGQAPGQGSDLRPFGKVERVASRIFESSAEWQDVTSYNPTDPGILLGGISYGGGVFTIPRAGLYRVEGFASWGAISNGIRGVRIRVNGQLSPQYATSTPLSGGSGELYRCRLVMPTHYLRLQVGDTINLAVYQDSGISVGLFGAIFSAEFIRSI